MPLNRGILVFGTVKCTRMGYHGETALTMDSGLFSIKLSVSIPSYAWMSSTVCSLRYLGTPLPLSTRI